MNLPVVDGPPRLPKLIHRPDLQGWWSRGVSTALSTLGWLVWLYLFAPLFSLLAWYFGFRRFKQYLLTYTGHDWVAFQALAIGVLLACALLLLWATYNLIRFRGKERRSPMPPVSDEAIMAVFHVSAEQMHCLRRAKVMRVRHDDSGQVVGAVDVTSSVIASMPAE